MRRELAELIGSGLLLGGLVLALIATVAPAGTGVASAGVDGAADGQAAAPAAPAAAETPSPRGLVLFRAKGCVACHILYAEGSAQIGPPLTRLGEHAGQRRPGVSAADYVRESLRTPSAFIVPGYDFGRGTSLMPDLGLSDEEVETLTEFLLSYRP